MEELSGQNFKEWLEENRDTPGWEERGDEFYIEHDDVEVRMLWAFHRPSGSHPRQISDPDPLVSAMAFNHSRIAPIERFRLLHPDVLKKPNLLIKIRNRSRMIFRSLVDEDFTDLVRVLEEFPQFSELAWNQIRHGRRWLENSADMVAASRFLEIAGIPEEDSFRQALRDRMEQLDGSKEMEDIQELLERLKQNHDSLHPFVIQYYKDSIERWMELKDLHPLKRAVLKKRMKDANVDGW